MVIVTGQIFIFCLNMWKTIYWLHFKKEKIGITCFFEGIFNISLVIIVFNFFHLKMEVRVKNHSSYLVLKFSNYPYPSNISIYLFIYLSGYLCICLCMCIYVYMYLHVHIWMYVSIYHLFLSSNYHLIISIYLSIHHLSFSLSSSAIDYLEYCSSFGTFKNILDEFPYYQILNCSWQRSGLVDEK